MKPMTTPSKEAVDTAHQIWKHPGLIFDAATEYQEAMDHLSIVIQAAIDTQADRLTRERDEAREDSARLREENLRLKRHLIFQDDADKDPQAVYDVVRRDEIKKLREQLAAVKKILEMEVEISTKAICIMDGNAPRIDYADQAQPELLRKLCEHLLAWDEVVKGKGILEYSLAAITRERDQLREQYNTLVTARNTAFDILGGQP